jgi:hypothetical protein
MFDWLKRWGLWVGLGGAMLAGIVFVFVGKRRAALALDIAVRGALAKQDAKRLLDEHAKVITGGTKSAAEIATLDQLVKAKQFEIARLSKDVGSMTDDAVDEALRARGLIH